MMSSGQATKARTPPEPPAAIQRSDPLPYYAQLAQILREEIERGRWAPGEMLPSEAELGDFFSLSRTAVRQALDVLRSEGLVRTEKGRGTFVARPKVAEFVVQELRGFHEEMTQRGRRVETTVLAQEVIEAPPEVAQNLEIPMGAEVVLLHRIRSVEAEPVVEVTTFLPAARFARLIELDLTDRSLYSALEQEFGVAPRGGVRSIEAVTVDRATARHLGIGTDAPVLRLDAINLDAERRPFEFFRAHYRGDQTTFQIWLEART